MPAASANPRPAGRTPAVLHSFPADRGRALRTATGSLAAAAALLIVQLLVTPAPAFAADPSAATPTTPAAGPATDAGGLEGPDNAAAVERILTRIAAHAGHETRFVEQRYLRFLDGPVESSGLLRYQPPDRLERLTEKPRPESMILDGDTLSMTRDGRTRSLGVSQLPAVGALVGSIRDLLAGDRVAIERRYRTIAQGDDGNWQLVLLPSDTSLAELVTRIVVAGQADRMRTIEILQADGDRSLMTLQPS